MRNSNHPRVYLSDIDSLALLDARLFAIQKMDVLYSSVPEYTEGIYDLPATNSLFWQTLEIKIGYLKRSIRRHD